MNVWVFVGTLLGCVLYPIIVFGAACGDFPWTFPRGMNLPVELSQAQEMNHAGREGEAYERVSAFLNKYDAGVFVEGAQFLLASLPHPTEEPGKEFMKQIDRLQFMRKEYSTSPYAPWALCMMGDLYGKAGWNSEAHGVYEEFLKTYPDHELAGGVMVEAGHAYVENRQYLEAALVYRRVIEEPKWERHRIRGALGLARATALSGAWKQAGYWFHVVDAERPDLIRQSSPALFYFGETLQALGHSDQARNRYLLNVNLHPRETEAGMAFVRLSEAMFAVGNDYLGLWFAEQAHQQFAHQEAGRRGHAALIRWVVAFLREDHKKEEWVRLYQRLDDLEIYLSVSWDHVLESARLLRRAPEADLAEESGLWMAHGYEQVGDRREAIQAFASLVENGSHPAIRKSSEVHLRRLLLGALTTYQRKKDWVTLLKFHDDHQKAFKVLSLDRDLVLPIAEAYQGASLPEQALKWYDQLLSSHPEPNVREEMMLRKVGLADDFGLRTHIQAVGEEYLHEFPQGKWRGLVLTLLGVDDMEGKRFAAAIAHLSQALDQVEDPEAKRFVLRNRARAYLGLNDVNKARGDYEALVEEGSSHTHDIVRLGDVSFDQGDYADAKHWYQRVREERLSPPVQAWVTYRLGVTYERMGKHEEAEPLLKEVRQREAKPPDVEHSIRLAAAAVLDEFSLQGKPKMRNEYGQAQP